MTRWTLVCTTILTILATPALADGGHPHGGLPHVAEHLLFFGVPALLILAVALSARHRPIRVRRDAIRVRRRD